jgi:3-methylcrotonyl-CoA carboxylase alpha subunit
VQVFGDAHGTVVHLFERDCSLQRRHQKVIEEAPAPGMDEATREAICAAAVRAAKAVDYEGAGTIEFIADASEGLCADRIFFMEMNTRLQVEHPVTEEITGVDLVEWQLQVASGEPIPLRQEELSINGHAIEARLYAEDPAKGFLPSTGPLDYLSLSGRRVETGVLEGDVVSPFYDPMIAKLVSWGADRDQAIDDLLTACLTVVVEPVKTNAWFLARLLSEPDFRTAHLSTGFIGDNQDRLIEQPEPSPQLLASAAEDIAFDDVRSRPDEFMQRSLFGFRLNCGPKQEVALKVDGKVAMAKVDEAALWEDYARPVVRDGDVRTYFEDGAAFTITAYRHDGTGQASAADGAILAPMPGKVIAVDVVEGQQVTAGQRLLVLEAMKMEHALTAPFDGMVTELNASEGGQVQVEAVLAMVVPVET